MVEDEDAEVVRRLATEASQLREERGGVLEIEIIAADGGGENYWEEFWEQNFVEDEVASRR